MRKEIGACTEPKEHRKISYKSILNAMPLGEMQKFSPDLVVAIGNSGIAAGAIAAAALGVPVVIMRISLYGEGMPPKELHAKPVVESMPEIPLAGKKVLIADDILRSGRTMKLAKEKMGELGVREARSFVLCGEADYRCFPFEGCVAIGEQKEQEGV